MDVQGAAAGPSWNAVATEPMPLVSFRCPSARYTCRLTVGIAPNHRSGPNQPPRKVDSVSGLQSTRPLPVRLAFANASEMAHPMQLPTSATLSSPRELTNSSSIAT